VSHVYESLLNLFLNQFNLQFHSCSLFFTARRLDLYKSNYRAIVFVYRERSTLAHSFSFRSFISIALNIDEI